MIRRLATVLALLALSTCALPSLAQTPAGPQSPNAPATNAPNAPNAPPTSPPLSTPLPGLPTPAPATAAPAAAPAATAQPGQGAILRFTGQLLDLRNGYVYFTTGDAFKVASPLQIKDYDNGGPTTLEPHPKLFAQAILDPASHEVVELDLTKRHLPPDKTYAQVQSFAVVKSPTAANPELGNGRPITGREVPVAFVVEVPPTTPIDASIYVSTDVSQWNPQAIKLNRIDATHYRTTFRFPSGTRLAYKITRGSWTTEETDARGLEGPPHSFFVREIDSQLERVVVQHWSDERGGAAVPVSPGAIPTPFNPNPFPQGGIFPGGNTRPAGAPTPVPGCPPNLPNCH